MNNLNEIYNNALKMALEFGENLNKPVAPRILKMYDFIEEKAATEIDKTCITIKSKAFDFIYKRYNELEGQENFTKLKSDFFLFFRTNYKWINDDNLMHLFSQNCYLASK